MTRGVTIDGSRLVPLREIVDSRGSILHMLRADASDFVAFGECYFSEIRPGVIKGWKRHQRQTQNLTVPVGRVRFVILDTREWSETQGAIDVVELGRPDAYARLSIPPMLWYGFACMGATAGLVANCTDLLHDPAESDVLGLDAFEETPALDLLRGGGPRP